MIIRQYRVSVPRAEQDYVPTKRLLRSIDAASTLTKSITATNIYRNAEDFAKVLHPPTHCQM